MCEKYRIIIADGDRGARDLVQIRQNLAPEDGEHLFKEIQRLIEEGHLKWEVGLKELVFCDSITLGIFVILHMAAHRFAADIQFTVNKGSQVQILLGASKLDRILTIHEFAAPSNSSDH